MLSVEELEILSVMKRMTCNGCGKEPHELSEYRMFAQEEDYGSSLDNFDDLDPDEENEQIDRWAWYNEGTMNHENGHYLCTTCYIKEGMPSSPTGWVAP